MIKIKNHHPQNIYANNLYGWAMLQKLPVRNLKQIEKDDVSQFDEKLIKNYDKNSDKGHILEVDST